MCRSSRLHGNSSDVDLPGVRAMERAKERNGISFFDHGIEFVSDIREECLDIIHT